MTIRIRNWSRFQHFKDRRPPWIKLHREILDQRDINLISDRSFRVLVGLWLLASEDPDKEGTLPPVEDIAFRLRMQPPLIIKALRELESFLVQDDINAISDRYQDDAPETETETEKRESTAPDGAEISIITKKGRKLNGDQYNRFMRFWNAYRMKKGRAEAADVWLKILPDIETTNRIVDAAEREAEARPMLVQQGHTPKWPEGWLSGRRWEDSE